VELWPNLTGGEAIDLFARRRGGFDQRRRDELCERFDLDPTKKGRTYSKGNRQTVALISALASDVELLLLDEPTAGLDPLMESVDLLGVVAVELEAHVAVDVLEVVHARKSGERVRRVLRGRGDGGSVQVAQVLEAARLDGPSLSEDRDAVGQDLDLRQDVAGEQHGRWHRWRDSPCWPPRSWPWVCSPSAGAV
jgi:ABC-type molybdate transport system ATPase subunit